jgi:PadR family transcriptional regulator, regulatory protein PadR
MQGMAEDVKLSHTAAMVLQSIELGHIYGYSVMEVTGLPSGTVYPALRRLERDDLIVSRWEKRKMAEFEQRPPRKYYKITRAGNQTLKTARKRYPLLAKLAPAEVEQV